MKRRFPILLLILIAVALRLAAMIWTDSLHQPGAEDQAIAESLVKGQGFSFQEFHYFGPTSVRPPIYPFLLACIFKVFGTGKAGLIVALIINLFAAGVSVKAAHRIGRNLFQTRLAGNLFAILIAFWPGLIVASTYLTGLSLSLCFFLISLWMITSPRSARIPLAGVFAGLAILTESVLLLPIAGVLIWICAYKPSRMVIAGLATLCLIVPWIYRNYIVHDQFTGITNTTWSDMYLGNGPDATGSKHLNKFDYSGKPLTRLDLASPIEIDQFKKQPESRRSEIFQQWSSKWIEENPLSYIKLCVIRIFKSFWMDWNHPRAWNLLNLLPRTLALVAMVIAVIKYRPKLRFRNQTIEEIPTLDPLESADQMFGHKKVREEYLNLSPIALSAVLTVAIALATALTMAEARNSIFVDIAQLLAVAILVDKKRET